MMYKSGGTKRSFYNVNGTYSTNIQYLKTL